MGRCRDCLRSASRRFHLKNKAKRNAETRAYMPGWRLQNQQKIKENSQRYYSENRDERLRSKAEWVRRNWGRIHLERTTDPQKRLRHILSASIAIQVRSGGARKGSSTHDLLGCSIIDFRRHIESLWLPEMSWSNWGRRRGCWHLDHKRPVSSFDLTDLNQQKACFHYSNYQPLWAPDNIRKSNHWVVDEARVTGV